MFEFMDGKIPAVMQNAIVAMLKQFAPDLPQQIDEIGRIVAHYQSELAAIRADQAEILSLLKGRENVERPADHAADEASHIAGRSGEQEPSRIARPIAGRIEHRDGKI